MFIQSDMVPITDFVHAEIFVIGALTFMIFTSLLQLSYKTGHVLGMINNVFRSNTDQRNRVVFECITIA